MDGLGIRSKPRFYAVNKVVNLSGPFPSPFLVASCGFYLFSSFAGLVFECTLTRRGGQKIGSSCSKIPEFTSIAGRRARLSPNPAGSSLCPALGHPREGHRRCLNLFWRQSGCRDCPQGWLSHREEGQAGFAPAVGAACGSAGDTSGLLSPLLCPHLGTCMAWGQS